MSTIGVGVISAGGAGRAHIARFLKNPRAEVVVVYDPKATALAETRSQLTKAFGAGQVDFQATTDLDDFLNRRDIDAVSVCSPDHLHCDHVCAALERGWHVLCEKPMATTTADAEKMLAAGAKSGRKLMIHHQMRYLPVFDRSRDLVMAGELGRVFSVDADYCHDMRERASLYDDWRLNPKSFQQIVLGGGCHAIDLMQWMLADQVAEVFSFANHQAFASFPDVDTVVAVMRFRNGQVGRMMTTYGVRYPGTRHSLSVFGSEGTLLDGLLLRTSRPSSMSYFPMQYRSRSQRWLGRLLMRFGDVVHFPYDHNEHDLACEALIDDFVEAVLSDLPSPIPPSESADVIRVCEAIIRSYRSGMPVTVER